jgi:hypothetical protein
MASRTSVRSRTTLALVVGSAFGAVTGGGALLRLMPAGGLGLASIGAATGASSTSGGNAATVRGARTAPRFGFAAGAAAAAGPVLGWSWRALQRAITAPAVPAMQMMVIATANMRTIGVRRSGNPKDRAACSDVHTRPFTSDL